MEAEQKTKKKKYMSAGKWLLVIAALLVVFAAVPVIDEYIPRKVTVRYITFDGEIEKQYGTRAHKVSEFVFEHSHEITDADILIDLSEPEDTFIKNGMMVRVKKAEEKTARIGGKKRKIRTYPGTVAETLGYNGIEWDEDDEIRPALDDELGFDDEIKITRVKVVTKKKKETIEPKEKGAVFDSSLASGTIVRTEGKAGTAVYKYTYKYVNGKKKKTIKEFDHWAEKPTDIQLRFGTSVTGETGEVDFSETFIGNCTAYYFGKNAHGATGGHCHYGTCAVDPSVIPYGTKLYVEGYGTAVANDCGGAVKGHIVDLYMRSTKECFSWGRRNKKVYVLK